MTKEFLNKLQKGIKNAGMETIAGLWENMSTSESTDIRILCERKGLALSLNNIAEILSNNSGIRTFGRTRAKRFRNSCFNGVREVYTYDNK